MTKKNSCMETLIRTRSGFLLLKTHIFPVATSGSLPREAKEEGEKEKTTGFYA